MAACAAGTLPSFPLVARQHPPPSITLPLGEDLDSEYISVLPPPPPLLPSSSIVGGSLEGAEVAKLLQTVQVRG